MSPNSHFGTGNPIFSDETQHKKAPPSHICDNGALVNMFNDYNEVLM